MLIKHKLCLSKKRGRAMNQKAIQFEIDCNTPDLCKCHVIIPQELVQHFFKHAVHVKQKDSDSQGFKKGNVPFDYIQVHYKKNILNHMQEIFLKHFVIDALLEYIHNKKILIVGQLKLTAIRMDLDQDTIYTFEGILPKETYIHRWKNLPFKATQRKKYRDIDNQVKHFLEEEEFRQVQFEQEKAIQINDWVCFDTWIVDLQNQPLFPLQKSELWLKIGDEEPDLIFQELFLHKKVDDIIITNNQSLRHYFCHNFDVPYTYAIHIKDRLAHKYFSIEYLKHHFKLKTKKDLHNKLIEIFSYSSDISQARSIADTALNTIIKRNNILVPQSSIQKQKEVIIAELQQKPDYALYKMKSDFDIHITSLAKKQLYETVAADYIAYSENLNVNHTDIKAYLNLLQRPRTKEFIYFTPPETQLDGQEFPITSESLKKACLREKALNHIIHHLTR
jgi:FKBP-type peptidyl-prolyl cis-trans isomerase (trigger factor)